MKSGLWFRCIFGSVSSINVILTHTKKGQSKQVHFRELKPHLIGQTPGLEMYSFFFREEQDPPHDAATCQSFWCKMVHQWQVAG